MITDFEQHLLPNGTEVFFYPDTHTYIVNGEELPSITQLLKNVYGNQYSHVNPDVLKRAADYGTAVHAELQELIELRKEIPDIPIVSSHQETENYFKHIEPIYKIEPITTEKVVVLYKDEKPAAAGRFDLLCFVKGEKTLCDFKTTSTIQKQYVTGQLNLYLKAARQSGYLTQDEPIKLGVIQLSGETCKYAPIPKLNDDFYLTFLK